MDNKRKNKRKNQRIHNQNFENHSNRILKNIGISKSDKQLDKQSDDISYLVKSNWSNYGVALFHDQRLKGFTKLSYEQRLSSKMFLEYGNSERFFHITSPLNWSKIQNEGLKHNRVNHNSFLGQNGYIYVIQSSNKDVWNYIGYNQLGVGVVGLNMVVVEIMKGGITGKLFSEEGGEYTTPLHTVNEQDVIEPKYLKKVYEFTTNRTDFYKFRPTLKRLKDEFIYEKLINIESSYSNNLIHYKNAS